MTITAHVAAAATDDALRAYLAANRRRIENLHKLARTAKPANRSAELMAIATETATMSTCHASAFPTNPLDAGLPAARTLAAEALLFALLADVELAAADPGRGRRWSELAPAVAIRPVADMFDSGRIGTILDRMAAADLAARQQMLGDLAEAVEPVVGPVVGQNIYTLPAPGWRGPTPVPSVRTFLQSRPAQHAIAAGMVLFFAAYIAAYRTMPAAAIGLTGLLFTAAAHRCLARTADQPIHDTVIDMS